MKQRTSDLLFFALLLCLLLLTSGGHLVVGDEETMFRVTQNLVSGRDLAVGRETLTLPAQSNSLFLPATTLELPTTSAVTGRDGKLFSKYALGLSLLAVPLYLLGQGLAAVSGAATAGDAARLWVSFLNPLALAGCGWLLLRFSRAFGFRQSTGRWLALAFVFASMAWPYAKTFYPQPALTFLLLWLVYACCRWRWQPSGAKETAIAAAAAGIVLVRPSEAILLPLVGIYLLWAAPHHRHWRAVSALTIGTLFALLVTAWYNWYRFGSLLQTGYHEIAWTTPPVLGLYGLLVSPGKGILLYAPLLVLALGAWPLFARRHRREALLFGGLWLALLAFYAPYNFWTGGFNWGPRFLLPVLPFGLLPIGSLLDQPGSRPWLAKVIFLLLFGLGVCLQLPAVLADQSRYLYQHIAGRDEAQAYAETIYNLPDSPLVRQWPIALELLTAYAQPEVRQEAAEAMTSLSMGTSTQDIPNESQLLQDEFKRQNTPDFWWYHLYLRRQASGRGPSSPTSH